MRRQRCPGVAAVLLRGGHLSVALSWAAAALVACWIASLAGPSAFVERPASLSLASRLPAGKGGRWCASQAALSSSTVELPEGLQEIQEVKALEAAARYSQVDLRLPEEFADGPVGTTFIGPKESPASGSQGNPLLLVHGFDSSSLEFRRFLPELEALGLEVYLLDLLGWGFCDTSGVKDFSPAAKRAHLYAFWEQHLGGRPMVLGGASLGGGIAIDFAVAYPEAVESLVLLDPQGFIDGAPQLGPLGGLGIKVLASWPLRWLANQMAYYDKEKYATDDAIRIGRLHVETESWETAALDFMNSGGYVLSPIVSKVQAPTLLLWGDNDEILNAEEQVPRFLEELQGPVQVEYIADSGHVPHLEQPKRTADLVASFLAKRPEAKTTA